MLLLYLPECFTGGVTKLLWFYYELMCFVVYFTGAATRDKNRSKRAEIAEYWVLNKRTGRMTDCWIKLLIAEGWTTEFMLRNKIWNAESWTENWSEKRCCGRLNYAVPDLCCEFWWELHETSQWIVIYTRRTTLCCSMPKIMLFYATMTEMKMLLKNKRSTTRNYAPPSSLRGTTFNTEETKMKTNNGLWLLT